MYLSFTTALEQALILNEVWLVFSSSSIFWVQCGCMGLVTFVYRHCLSCVSFIFGLIANVKHIYKKWIKLDISTFWYHLLFHIIHGTLKEDRI